MADISDRASDAVEFLQNLGYDMVSSMSDLVIESETELEILKRERNTPKEGVDDDDGKTEKTDGSFFPFT